MMRAGGIRVVEGSGKTQGQRLMEMFGSMYGFSGSGAQGMEALQGAIDELRAAGEISRTTRMELRGDIVEWLEEGMRARGQSAKPSERQLESLALRVEKELLDEGRSVQEVAKMIEMGELRP
ncbi:MAG: hypothetical protein IIA30_09855 [Myxococcales bacterium]|nr:hypothetical protein [Myxococcales bacterium]